MVNRASGRDTEMDRWGRLVGTEVETEKRRGSLKVSKLQLHAPSSLAAHAGHRSSLQVVQQLVTPTHTPRWTCARPRARVLVRSAMYACPGVVLCCVCMPACACSLVRVAFRTAVRIYVRGACAAICWFALVLSVRSRSSKASASACRWFSTSQLPRASPTTTWTCWW